MKRILFSIARFYMLSLDCELLANGAISIYSSTGITKTLVRGCLPGLIFLPVFISFVYLRVFRYKLDDIPDYDSCQ